MTKSTQAVAFETRRNVGAKRALKPRQVWAIRFFLDQHRRPRLRDRAVFDLPIDSKLRGCDVVKVKIGDSWARTAANDRFREERT